MRFKVKIAISGAQSTGKTTLLNVLSKDSKFNNYKIFQEITRYIKSKGFNINEQGTCETQIAIMCEHYNRLLYKGNSIYDRCTLDGVVYTKYLYNHNTLNIRDLQFAEYIFNNTIAKYDKIFYIKPEFQIKNDGVRSVNIEFRDEIVSIFNEYIVKHNIHIIELTGSVENRVNKIKENVNE